jgi:hypothetical protein
VKIVAISDTYGKYKNFNLSQGDIFIHVGEVSSLGKEFEI